MLTLITDIYLTITSHSDYYQFLLDYKEGECEYIDTIASALCTSDYISDQADIHTLKHKLINESKLVSNISSKAVLDMFHILKLIASDIHEPYEKIEIYDIYLKDNYLYIELDILENSRSFSKLDELAKELKREITKLHIDRLLRV